MKRSTIILMVVGVVGLVVVIWAAPQIRIGYYDRQIRSSQDADEKMEWIQKVVRDNRKLRRKYLSRLADEVGWFGYDGNHDYCAVHDLATGETHFFDRIPGKDSIVADSNDPHIYSKIKVLPSDPEISTFILKLNGAEQYDGVSIEHLDGSAKGFTMFNVSEEDIVRWRQEGIWPFE